MTVAVPAIFCTVALPAYAASDPAPKTAAAAQAAAKLDALKASGAQEENVDAGALTVGARADYSATSAAELEAARLEQQRAQLKAAMAARAATYSGPSVRQLLSNPPYPSFSLAAVAQVAQQYQGVPYVYGGSTPAGFDCSGFVMYVYAQFGVALPHSSSAQGRLPQIAPSAAVPGDIIVFDGGSHVGIYLGGNMMIHAPYPGRTVSIQQIYTTNHYFVRAGI
ncbi:C40 family peptidase [Pseudolysinimonas sp.]|uniref:C40 family peptidase n=1 Tax=Pseudolysinimonas sp. TaxID=2680009 RepID=UPI003F7F812D